MDNLEEMDKFFKVQPSKTKLGRNRKYEQSNHKHWNQNCDEKSSNKQKCRAKWLHKWILPNI